LFTDTRLDYAADDAALLTELCVTADPRHHGAFFAALRAQESAVARLRAVVPSEPQAGVVRAVPTDLAALVDAAQGVLAGEWGDVPGGPVAEWDELVTRLAAAERIGIFDAHTLHAGPFSVFGVRCSVFG
jgi:hypothetical protein